MSSRLPTWHTYARRVHRIHACVATNRLLTANILKSIAPIRTRKRDFLVHLQLCHFNKRSNRSFCNCFRRGRHSSEKKRKAFPMGSLRQIYRLGIYKHTDTSSNHTTYTTSKKLICYKLYQILIHATKIIISCNGQQSASASSSRADQDSNIICIMFNIKS